MTLKSIAILAILASACTPHPDVARRALLGRGLGQVRIRDAALACIPAHGVRFEAIDPGGVPVSGRVCCAGLRCDVVEDERR